MTRNFLIAALMVGLVASSASASVQNIKVSGDIDNTWVIRKNFDLGADTAATPGINLASEKDQNTFLSQIRLRVDADLTDNVSATIALINERPWGEETSIADDTDIDVNLAFVELREVLNSPATLKIGRQQLNYGNAFIVGAGGPNNSATGALSNVAADLTKRTALDAVKLVLDYEPLTVDIFYAQVDENVATGAYHADDDVSLFGVNTNYQLGDDMETVIEGYVFVKHDDLDNAAPNGAKADIIYAPGLRVSTNPIKGLNLQAEGAVQLGNKATTHTAGTLRNDNLDREALGVQLIANYMVPVAEDLNPVVNAVYTFVSGDSNPYTQRDNGATPASEEVWNAWDPLFEDQNAGTIYNAIFNQTNMHIISLAGQINPMEDVTARLAWTGLWLDKSVSTDHTGTDGNAAFVMVQPDGANVLPTVTSDSELGHEFDVDLTYDYTEDVQFGVTMGWFVPGDFFAGNNDKTASQVLTNVSVAF